MEMGWLLSTSLVSGNTAVLERRRADTRLCQRNHKIMLSSLPPHPPSLSSALSSTWCPASPCPRTCPQRRPPTYLRRPPHPPRQSRPWRPCPRCRRYWEEPTSPVWEPCAGGTRTNTPCPSRQVGPTTQRCMSHHHTHTHARVQSAQLTVSKV